MSQILFRNEMMVFSNQSLVFSDDPANCACCNGTCEYQVEAYLNWDDATNADLDVYLDDNGTVVYYANPTGPTASLNHDAHPTCSDTPNAPEIITGTYTADGAFRGWYNQWSACAAEQHPSVKEIRVHNTGSTDLDVNGTTLRPGDTWSDTLAYGGYDQGDQSGYTGGTSVSVTCL
jgi:hypothetical protein